jgi:hypothetical protein
MAESAACAPPSERHFFFKDCASVSSDTMHASSPEASGPRARPARGSRRRVLLCCRRAATTAGVRTCHVPTRTAERHPSAVRRARRRLLCRGLPLRLRVGDVRRDSAAESPPAATRAPRRGVKPSCSNLKPRSRECALLYLALSAQLQPRFACATACSYLASPAALCAASRPLDPWLSVDRPLSDFCGTSSSRCKANVWRVRQRAARRAKAEAQSCRCFVSCRGCCACACGRGHGRGRAARLWRQAAHRRGRRGRRSGRLARRAGAGRRRARCRRRCCCFRFFFFFFFFFRRCRRCRRAAAGGGPPHARAARARRSASSATRRAGGQGGHQNAPAARGRAQPRACHGARAL